MKLEQVNKQGLEQNFDEFLAGSGSKVRRNERFMHINISRNSLIALVFSLLMHGLVLFFAVPKIQLIGASPPPPRAMEVSLMQPVPVTAEPEQAAEPMPEWVQEQVPVPAETLKESPKKIVTKPELPVVIAKIPAPVPQASEKPSFDEPEPAPPAPQPTLDAQLPKEPEADDSPPEEPITDMQSYVKAMQAKRNTFEAYAAKQNAAAVARELGPSEAQISEERIRRNFQHGTNGIFEITSLGTRNATFAFRGWLNDYSSSKRQFFEVEASNGEDVRLVMIKRMIALIRQHYHGDFNWESQRLGRVVVQSARPEDNAGLEDFLMMEFFGTNYRKLP